MPVNTFRKEGTPMSEIELSFTTPQEDGYLNIEDCGESVSFSISLDQEDGEGISNSYFHTSISLSKEEMITFLYSSLNMLKGVDS